MGIKQTEIGQNQSGIERKGVKFEEETVGSGQGRRMRIN